MRYEAASNSPFPKMDRRVEEIRKKRGNTGADQGSRNPTLANPARMGHPLSGSLMQTPKREEMGHPPAMNGKKDCERLMNSVLPLAERMLRDYGDFHPYGGYMKPN